MKIYTRTYNVNYLSLAKAKPPLTVPAGKMVCFQIPFPSEGFMERVVVYQQIGDAGPQGPQGPQDATPVAFSIELLSSQLPYPPGEYAPTDQPFDVLNQYRIQTPPTSALSATAGNVITMTDDDFGPGFRNLDGGWTLNQRYIYLVIKPVSASAVTEWNVFFQCRTDIN